MTSSPVSEPEALPTVAPSRRRWLWGAIAGASALAGGSLAWWRLRPHEVSADALASFWAQSFERPDGQRLDLATLRGRPLLLNFWATWCPPCVEELPLLNRFFRENREKGWQVVGLAIDQPSFVNKFLTQHPLDFPVGLAGLGGSELGRSLGNEAGGLPFTVVFDPAGDVVQRKMGRVTVADLAAWSTLR